MWGSTALAVLLCLAGSASRAQLTGSIGADSDYRFRGVSLSDSRPTVRASVDWDGTSGWYAGATASTPAFARDERYRWLLGYFGYVRRTPSGIDWEAGATGSWPFDDARHTDAEAYAGLLGERWSLRLYYAPDYFGQRVQTVYTEFNAAVPIRPQLRLLGHVGVLASIGGQRDSGERVWRTDVRLGVGVALDPIDLQLAWAGASRGGPATDGARHGSWLLSITLAF